MSKVHIMKPVALLLLLVVGVLGLAAQANHVEGQIAFDPAKMMDVSDLQIGMKGICRTVYQGVDITEFNIEIMGILPTDISGQDMILIRMLDGPSVEKGYNIIGGMSGSPVYIDGKIIGAIAYGWSYPKDPICGVTPIRPMLEASAPTLGHKSSNMAAAPAFVQGHMVTSARLAKFGEEPGGGFYNDTTLSMQPLSMPVAVSGMSPRGMQLMQAAFRGSGIEIVQGGGSSGYPSEANNTKLVPGSAVGIMMMEGDVSAVGFGTVTWVDGDKVIAFGHPMDGFGVVNLPMCNVYVMGINSSIARSNKFGVGMKVLGAVEQDRPWSIGGTLGGKAPTVPMKLHIEDQDRNLAQDFQVTLASHPQYTASLAESAAMTLVGSMVPDTSPATLELSVEAEVKGHGLLKRSNMMYDSSWPAYALMMEMDNLLYLLQSNPFEKPELESVAVSVKSSGKELVASLADLYCPRTQAKPGETVPLVVTITPYNGKPENKTVNFTVPPECPDGTLRIAVGGGADWSVLKRQVGAPPIWPYDLDDLLEEYFIKPPRADELTVVASMPSLQVMVGPTTFPRMPESMLAILAQSNTTEIMAGPDLIEQRTQMPWMLGGMMTITLDVVSSEVGSRTTAHPPTAPPLPEGEEAMPLPPMPGDFTAELASTPTGKMLLASAELAPGLLPRAYRATNLLGQLEPRTSHRLTSGALRYNGELPPPGVPVPPDEGDLEEDAKGDEEPVGKTAPISPATYFIEVALTDFEDGLFDGVGVTSEGHLALVPKVAEVCQLETEHYAWSMLSTTEGLYLGTGNGGKLLFAANGGDVKEIAATGASAITALCELTPGTLCAGLAPGGKLVTLEVASGQVKPMTTLPKAQYIWALLPDGQGGSWAATGPEGQLFHCAPDGKSELVLDTDESHLLSLVKGTDDLLYLGTAPHALVMQFNPTTGLDSVLASLDGSETPALAASPEGGLYAASFPSGKVYEISSTGALSEFYANENADPVTALVATEGGCYIAGPTMGRIIKAEADGRWTLVYRKDDLVCTRGATGANGAAYIGVANNAAALEIEPTSATEGTFVSNVKDAEAAVTWGEAFWGGYNIDGNVTVETRTGNSPRADGSWSPWSGLSGEAQGSPVNSPAGRYIKYRISLKAGDQGAPELAYLKLLLSTPNKQPVVKIEGLATGDQIGHKLTIKLKPEDPDGDPLLTTVYYRKTDGTDWRVIKENITADNVEWDVAGLEAGEYFVKFVASDVRSRADQAREGTLIVGPVLIDTTLPELLLKRGSPSVDDFGAVTLAGFARDEGSGIVALEYQVDDQERFAVSAAEGSYSQKVRLFELVLPDLVSGEHTIKLFAIDGAGNETKLEEKVQVAISDGLIDGGIEPELE